MILRPSFKGGGNTKRYYMSILSNKLRSSFKTAKLNIQSKFGSEAVTMVEISKLHFDKDFKGLFTQEPEKVDRICKDMLLNGFDKSQPIIATEDGSILDGNSRYMAASKAGIKYVPVVYKTFQDKNEALIYEFHLQLDRRNLSDAEIYKMFTKLEELKNHAKKEGNSIASFTDSIIASSIHKSERQVQKIRELTRKAAPGTLQKIESGEMSINQAYSEVKKTEQAIHAETCDNTDNQEGVISEFEKGVHFALEEIAKGRTSDEIINNLKEASYGKF